MSGQTVLAIVLLVGPMLLRVLKNLSISWGTVMSVSGRNVRLTRGLLDRTTVTVPLGAVHAVIVEQPNFWRPFGWWSATVLVASTIQEKKAPSHVIEMPAGKLEDVLRLLHVVLGDIGVADPRGFLVEALEGTTSMGGFRPNPRSSRWLDPIGWRRSGVALTPTAVVTRHGWLWSRTLGIVLHRHVQSMYLTQGPLERMCGVDTVNFGTIFGLPTNVRVRHMGVADSLPMAAEERRLAEMSSSVMELKG
ncbi:PH domain-containing protein [Neoactinobaculum massilliense]|uniref:PH domain-containing protein n=1 Tax=Neoactinobaculum massilliense TaxID=2364794 RepID=UPI000F54A483|nr:PH domain-containing protein [Neoactinobaculum massilliense]